MGALGWWQLLHCTAMALIPSFPGPHVQPPRGGKSTWAGSEQRGLLVGQPLPTPPRLLVCPHC